MNVNLGVSKLVLSVIYVDRAQEFLCSLLVVHELTLGNCTGVQDPVSGGSGGAEGLSTGENCLM